MKQPPSGGCFLCSESVNDSSDRIEKIWFVCHQITWRAVDYYVVYAARNKLDYRIEHKSGILPDITVGIDYPVVVFLNVY